MILQSTGRLYIGHTNNLERRLEEHNKGKSISTRNNGLWELVGFIREDTRSKAMDLEKKLKNFKRKDRVVRYIRTHGIIES